MMPLANNQLRARVCEPPWRSLGTSTNCAIYVRDENDKPIAGTFDQFKLSVSDDAELVIPQNQAPAPTLKFSVNVPSKGAKINVYAAVKSALTPKGGNGAKKIIGTPQVITLIGTASANSFVHCDRLQLKLGDKVNCTIDIKDINNQQTSCLGKDLNVYIGNDPINSPHLFMLPSKIDRTQYWFTYTAPYNGTQDIVHVTMRDTNDELMGSPIAFSFITPTSAWVGEIDGHRTRVEVFSDNSALLLLHADRSNPDLSKVAPQTIKKFNLDAKHNLISFSLPTGEYLAGGMNKAQNFVFGQVSSNDKPKRFSLSRVN
eukprot:TRINITY_DN1166_c0_g1_i3.p1 TRINITY_DN1166_c0_g1~~TRINITY_DN1166_c0_g1_i3.p1  ORF type:complete len:316 (-),score=118.32 TRINITY_DN1166_c0_g1_i3:90-1037(-)